MTTRTVSYQVYTIDDHPNPEAVYENWRDTHREDAWDQEWMESLARAWELLFNSRQTPDYSIDYLTAQVVMTQQVRNHLDELVDTHDGKPLQGIRLWKWLQVHWATYLYKPAFHYWIKENGQKENGQWSKKSAYSLNDLKRIGAQESIKRPWQLTRWEEPTKENSCPFTGYCGDESFLDPIREFLRRPDNETTLYELAKKATESWAEGWRMDMASQRSDEYLYEHFLVNGYEFTEDGELA